MIFTFALRLFTGPRPPADFAARRLAAVILPPLDFLAIGNLLHREGAVVSPGRLQPHGEWCRVPGAGIARRDGKRRTTYEVGVGWQHRPTRMNRTKTLTGAWEVFDVPTLSMSRTNGMQGPGAAGAGRLHGGGHVARLGFAA